MQAKWSSWISISGSPKYCVTGKNTHFTLNVLEDIRISPPSCTASGDLCTGPDEKFATKCISRNNKIHARVSRSKMARSARGMQYRKIGRLCKQGVKSYYSKNAARPCHFNVCTELQSNLDFCVHLSLGRAWSKFFQNYHNHTFELISPLVVCSESPRKRKNKHFSIQKQEGVVHAHAWNRWTEVGSGSKVGVKNFTQSFSFSLSSFI